MGFSRQRTKSTIPLLILLVFASCRSLPPKIEAPESLASDAPGLTFLEEISLKVLAEAPSPEVSAHQLLERNDEALAWRLALIDSAEHSLDFQTFIFHGDAAGYAISDRLLRAADRGVRVRVLLDDFHGGDDAFLVGFDRHPNMEIRIFNPWAYRSSGIWGGLEYLTRLEKLNSRMHNKSLIADNAVSIVGGRNVGDEYLGLREIGNFYDMDVLSLGPIAPEVASSFDLYWNSEPVYPARSFAKDSFKNRDLLAEVREDLAEGLREFDKSLPEFARGGPGWEGRFGALAEGVSFGRARVVYDKPVTGSDIPDINVIDSIDMLTLNAEEEVLAITPFFVPEKPFDELIKGLTERGVRAAVFTNSLSSVDHYAAHSGYRPWRKRLLKAGLELWELRRDAVDLVPIVTTEPNDAEYVGLHAKIFVIDRKLAYVGSLNLDPRSIYLNTEMGLIIEDPVLATKLAEIFDRNASGANGWQVLMDEKGDLEWKSDLGVLEWQPAQGSMQRLGAKVLGWLPIKKQL